MYTVVVDTTDMNGSLDAAERLQLGAAAGSIVDPQPREQWPELRVWGERDDVLKFLAAEIGNERDAGEYFADHAYETTLESIGEMVKTQFITAPAEFFPRKEEGRRLTVEVDLAWNNYGPIQTRVYEYEREAPAIWARINPDRAHEIAIEWNLGPENELINGLFKKDWETGEWLRVYDFSTSPDPDGERYIVTAHSPFSLFDAAATLAQFDFRTGYTQEVGR